jgi:hypothetical protein
MFGLTGVRVPWGISILVGFLVGIVGKPVGASELNAYSGIYDKLKNDELKKEFETFCKETAADFDKLGDLFSADCSELDDSEAQWDDICAAALTRVRKAQCAANNGTPSALKADAANWFKQLNAMWVGFQQADKGKMAFMAKVRLDEEMAKRTKSKERNKRTLDEDVKPLIADLDKSYGNAESFLKAINNGTEQQWLDNYGSDSFVEDFGNECNRVVNEAQSWGKNWNDGVKASKEHGAPDKLAGGEAGLAGWEIENEESWFPEFQTARGEWLAYLEGLHEDYKKCYDAWLDGLDWLLENEAFAGTNHMKKSDGWTWQNVGTNFETMYQKIR